MRVELATLPTFAAAAVPGVFGAPDAAMRSTVAAAVPRRTPAHLSRPEAAAAAAAVAGGPPPGEDLCMAVFDAPAGGLRALLAATVGRVAHPSTTGAAVVDALRAGAWAFGSPATSIATALSLTGDGFWVFPSGLGVAVAAAARSELAAIPDRYRHPIFNTTSVEEIRTAGRKGDRGRQQMALTAESLTAIGPVPALRMAVAAFDSLAALLDRLWGGPAAYRPVFPVALFSKPAAAQQLPHADACPMDMVGDPPLVLGGLLAVEDGTRLVTWPGAHDVLLAGGCELVAATCGGGAHGGRTRVSWRRGACGGGQPG
ncbi:hypothetical protein MMPV_004814 [Pyropia vietnamensis]